MDDFTTLRRYEPVDVATHLHIPKTWVKDWITLRLIPMQMSGSTRGVWFTYANILEIGRMLPALTTARQANARARAGLPAAVENLPLLDGEDAVASPRTPAREGQASVQAEGVSVTGAPAAAALERFRALRAVK